MKPITVLRRARDLIEKPQAWTQGVLDMKVGRSTAYCALGALCQVSVSDFPARLAAEQALRRVLPKYYRRSDSFGDPITEWNDAGRRTHSQVLAAFDKATALAEKAEA